MDRKLNCFSRDINVLHVNIITDLLYSMCRMWYKDIYFSVYKLSVYKLIFSECSSQFSYIFYKDFSKNQLTTGDCNWIGNIKNYLIGSVIFPNRVSGVIYVHAQFLSFYIAWDIL